MDKDIMLKIMEQQSKLILRLMREIVKLETSHPVEPATPVEDNSSTGEEEEVYSLDELENKVIERVTAAFKQGRTYYRYSLPHLSPRDQLVLYRRVVKKNLPDWEKSTKLEDNGILIERLYKKR